MTGWKRSLLLTLALAPLPSLGAAAEVHDCAALVDSALAMPDWYPAECGGVASEPAVLAPNGRVPGDTVYFLSLFGGASNPELTRRLLTAPLPTMTYTNVAPLAPAPQSLFAVDFDNTATTLWSIDSSCAPTCIGTAYGTINQSTGVFTPVGNITGAPANANFSSIKFDPTSSTVYIVALTTTGNSQLMSLNLATGVAIPIGGLITGAIIDIGISNGGIMYGHNISTDTLMLIDKATGVATPIGPTGFNANFSQGMDFDPSTNTLYAFVITLPNPPAAALIATVNLATGAFTPTANGFQELEGAIKVPVPGAAVFVRGDFNGDQKTDILWRHDESGENVVWFMNGPSMTGGTFTTPAALTDTRWKMVGTHDFNADLKTDILWRHNVSGENVVWFMNGTVLTGGTFTTPSALADTRWQMAGTGDFNGDGKPDIAWHHHDSGQIVLWYMNGTVLTSGTFTTPNAFPDTNTDLVGVADFSSPPDNKPDFVWRNRVTGDNLIWFMNNSVKLGEAAPPALSDTRWQIRATGEFSFDGKNDLVWRHTVSGENVMWFMNGATLLGGSFTNPSSFPDTRWQMVGPR
jgi:hypothetical protein